MLGEPRCALTWPGGGESAENSSGKRYLWCISSRGGPAGESAQVSWGERRVWPGGPGGGRRQARGGHSMPGGEAQVSPRTEQIIRELNPPGGQCAKNGFQVAVLKVWPRNPRRPIPGNPGDQTIFMIILRTNVPSSVPFFRKHTVEFLSDSWPVRSRQNGCKSRDESPAVVS